MIRALLPLRAFWAPELILPPLAFVSVALLPPEARALAALAFAAAFAALALILATRGRPLLRLCRRAAACRTLSGNGFNLHYPPSLAGRVEDGGVLGVCQHEWDWLTTQFGFSPRGNAAIYLFESEGEIADVAGEPCASYSYPQGSLVLVALGPALPGLLRHELTRLYSARLGPASPPLKSVGLAVFVESIGQVPPPGEPALHWLQEEGGLPALARRWPPRDGEAWAAAHVIAGGFTGFLIQRFGWEAYRRFYAAAPRRFPEAFERAFSLTLPEAESLWRSSVTAS